MAKGIVNMCSYNRNKFQFNLNLDKCCYRNDQNISYFCYLYIFLFRSCIYIVDIMANCSSLFIENVIQILRHLSKFIVNLFFTNFKNIYFYKITRRMVGICSCFRCKFKMNFSITIFIEYGHGQFRPYTNKICYFL